MTSHHDPLARYFQGSGQVICSEWGCLKPLTLPEQLCGTKCQGCQQPGSIVGVIRPMVKPEDTGIHKFIHQLEVELARWKSIKQPTQTAVNRIEEMEETIKKYAKTNQSTY